MSTAVMEDTRPVEAERPRTEHPPIPFRTVVGVELRKAFDTRSGFWLLAAIAAAGSSRPAR